jgi:hypothetical protein
MQAVLYPGKQSDHSYLLGAQGSADMVQRDFVAAISLVAENPPCVTS